MGTNLDRVWEILEEQGIVAAPKIPDVSKIVKKARTKGCSIQINYPADPKEDVLAIVTRQGQRFTAEEVKDSEALAIALSECLTETEPVQATMFDDEESGKVKKTGGVLDQVRDHLGDDEDEFAEDEVGDDTPETFPSVADETDEDDDKAVGV